MAKLNPEELFNLGMLSYDKQDFSKARKYFEKACDLNNGKGCKNLGSLYYNGDGVKQDSKKAATMFEKACELKESDACVALAGLYYNGDGVKQDSKKADALFEKACKLGDQKACELLKSVLMGGLMANPNPEELFNLGVKSYEEQDFSKARKYFEKACELGDQKACEALKE
ncbi:sel1 repeat family protein [Helicobacter pylori]|nr:sel1 repeat family protein [Helicobacter pylori]